MNDTEFQAYVQEGGQVETGDAMPDDYRKALLKCSYAPYARIMKKICWEESFHILHGRDCILALMTGTDEQRELVQEAVTRWWGPLMQFHGNPIPADDDPMYRWRIKSQA